MYANLSYPSYTLEIYLTLNEKKNFLSNSKLEGDLELLLRVFPIFSNKFKTEKLIKENGRLILTLGNHLSLKKTNQNINLILDRKQIYLDIFDISYKNPIHNGIYFHII